MRKIYLPVITLLYATSLYAQKVIDVDKDNVDVPSLYYTIGGNPISKAKYVRVVEGTAYFSEDWMKTTLVLGTDQEYRNIIARLDLLANAIEFKDKSGNVLITTVPIKKIIFNDTISGKSYTFFHTSWVTTDKTITPGWFQVLENGRAGMFKLVAKTITESQPYGSATVEQKIGDTKIYYVYAGDNLIRVKKLKELPDLLTDRKDKLNAFISEKKLYGKVDDDYRDVVAYYNSLFQ